MINIITLLALFGMVIPLAILITIFYPVSKKLTLAIADYTVKKAAPRVFSILSFYKHFNFAGDKSNFFLLPKQYMIISNHQSLLDIPLYMNFFCERDLRFVAKVELSRNVPLISPMLRSQGHCFISRSGHTASSMKKIEQFARRVLGKNQIPVLFPEGTRSRDGSVGKFYSGGFRKLAAATKLPIALCALDGGWKMRNLPTIMRKLQNGFYRIKLLKVYDAPSTKEEAEKILKEAPRLIQAQLDEWRKVQ